MQGFLAAPVTEMLHCPCLRYLETNKTCFSYYQRSFNLVRQEKCLGRGCNAGIDCVEMMHTLEQKSVAKLSSRNQLILCVLPVVLSPAPQSSSSSCSSISNILWMEKCWRVWKTPWQTQHLPAEVKLLNNVMLIISNCSVCAGWPKLLFPCECPPKNLVLVRSALA